MAGRYVACAVAEGPYGRLLGQARPVGLLPVNADCEAYPGKAVDARGVLSGGGGGDPTCREEFRKGAMQSLPPVADRLTHHPVTPMLLAYAIAPERYVHLAAGGFCNSRDHSRYRTSFASCQGRQLSLFGLIRLQLVIVACRM